jgi:hypothetical protein
MDFVDQQDFATASTRISRSWVAGDAVGVPNHRPRAEECHQGFV